MVASPKIDAGDTDGDGIDDKHEQEVLEKFGPPVFLFDKGETVWPCSATWFVTHSNLKRNSIKEIVPMSEVAKNPRVIFEKGGTWRADNKENDSIKLDIGDNFRRGPYIRFPKSSTNVPVYCHMVRLKDTSPVHYPGDSNTFGTGWTLIQYCWLFPYNNATKWDSLTDIYSWIPGTGNSGDVGDHEGDWICLDVLLDTNEEPHFAVYHHHGDSTLAPSVIPWPEVEKENGRPIAYLEKGVHELWPHKGPAGGIKSPIHDHQGNGFKIQPTTIINIGEPGHPIKQGNDSAQLDADLVLFFNGLWGDFVGPNPISSDANNPAGPVQQFFPAL